MSLKQIVRKAITDHLIHHKPVDSKEDRIDLICEQVVNEFAESLTKPHCRAIIDIELMMIAFENAFLSGCGCGLDGYNNGPVKAKQKAIELTKKLLKP